MTDTALALTISPLDAIHNRGERTLAVEQLAWIQTRRRKIRAHYTHLTAPAAETTRSIVQAERDHLEPFLVVEQNLQSLLTAYDQREAEAAEAVALDALTTGSAAPSLAPIEKTAGEQRRSNYRAEVPNLRELVAAVAAGEVALSCVTAHQPTLNGLARRDKEQFAIPGCALATRTQVITR